MDAIYMQVAAVAVVVAGYAAAQAWTRHAKDEDERRARTARRIPRPRQEPRPGRDGGVREAPEIPGYTDPRIGHRR